VALTLLLIFLAVLAAYYFLGATLLDYIHRFVQEFTHSFPLWAFFRLLPKNRGATKGPGEPLGPQARAAQRGGVPRV
jgi:hypothetical protein